MIYWIQLAYAENGIKMYKIIGKVMAKEQWMELPNNCIVQSYEEAEVLLKNCGFEYWMIRLIPIANKTETT